MAIPNENNVPPPEVADAGFNEFFDVIDECGEIDEHLDSLEILRRIEETHNRMRGMIERDTAKILEKRK